MKKLVEGLPFYRDKLHEEGVYARFQEILVKVMHTHVQPIEREISKNLKFFYK